MASIDAAKKDRPPSWKVWVIAARPHTLTLSFTPVLVGATLAATETKRVEVVPSLLFWVFAAMVQIGTNLHNDYSDFVKGADTEERVGQARATQKGWLSAKETLGGAFVALAVAAAAGGSLERFCEGRRAVTLMRLVVSTSTFNAVAYTGGFPLTLVGLGDVSLGYWGVADVFVLLYFGYVATVAPYSLQTQKTPALGEAPLLWVAATSMGFLATGVIVVNNLRDRQTDVKVGKRTLAVRFGPAFARRQYLALVVGAYLLPLAAVGLGYAPASWLLVYVSAFLAKAQVRAVLTKDGPDLNPHVGGTAKLQLAFGTLLSLGIALARYS